MHRSGGISTIAIGGRTAFRTCRSSKLARCIRPPIELAFRGDSRRPTVGRGVEGCVTEVILKRFESPDETRTFPKGKFEIIHIAGMTIGRATYEPGWRWARQEKPVESRLGAGADAERRPVSQPRSSNRTCGFPASGFPTGFVADSRTHAHWPLQTDHAQRAKHPFLRELAGACQRRDKTAAFSPVL